MEELESLRRVRKPEVLRLTGWSSPTLHRRIKDGRFPPPLHDGGRAFWRAAVVEEALRKDPFPPQKRGGSA